MQAALPSEIVFPPPAAGPQVFSRQNRARAGLAAYRREALRMQRVERNLVRRDVGFEPLQRPVGDGIDLDQAMVAIPFREWHVSPARRLLTPQAGDPA